VAPQFEHSALTPPGAVLLCPLFLTAAELVAVAPGPVDRVLGEDCVRTVRAGLPVGVFAPDPASRGTILDGPIRLGRSARVVWDGAGCW
jgi:hypothetical protein